jgi:hypothetical protein
MGKINRTKLLDREHDRRDARLFVIATEGAVTEKQYFSLFQSSRVKIEILAAGDNKSAPEYVLKRLDVFREQYDLNEEDMLWLVIDVDRWGDKKLSTVCRAAKQKSFSLAVSNPCFEVWLCLHFLEELDPRDKTCRHFEQRLKNILDEYNKSNLDISQYEPQVSAAIERAKKLHPEPQQNWPPTIGTHVYRLVEALRASF